MIPWDSHFYAFVSIILKILCAEFQPHEYTAAKSFVIEHKLKLLIYLSDKVIKR